MEKIDEDFFCENCKLQFGKKYVFDLHLSLVHGQKIEVKSEPIDFEENIQGPEIFQRDYSKVQAQKIEVKHDINICEENIQEPVFFEKDSSKGFKRLTGSVQQDKPFKCNNCDASFANNYQIKVHKDSVHEGKKPFKCNICDASFSQKVHLKRHVSSSIHEKRSLAKQIL